MVICAMKRVQDRDFLLPYSCLDIPFKTLFHFSIFRRKFYAMIKFAPSCDQKLPPTPYLKLPVTFLKCYYSHHRRLYLD